MKTSFSILAFAAAIGFSPVANAQWYVNGHGGLTVVQDSDITESGAGVTGAGEIEFDTGFAVGGAIGRSFGPIRVEGELSYRMVDLDQITVDSVTVGNLTASGLGSFPIEGEASALAFMINGWYDFNAGSNLVPFIGGGVGIARVNAQVDSVAGVASTFDEDETVFAYQAGAGVGYKVAPSTMITVEYRYFGTQDPEFESGGVNTDLEFGSHNFLAGVRVTF